VAVPSSASVGIIQTFITATDKERGRTWMRQKQNVQFQSMQVSVDVKVVQILLLLLFHSFFTCYSTLKV